MRVFAVCSPPPTVACDRTMRKAIVSHRDLAEPLDESLPPEAPRARIRQAAVELFVVQGFKGTSVRDITTACHLTPGALYNHFPSKEAVLHAIISETHHKLEMALDEAMADVSDDPAHRLFRLVEAFAKFHHQHRREALVANLEYVELDELHRLAVVQSRRALRTRFEVELHAGIEAGLFAIPSDGGENAIKLVATAISNMAIRISEVHGPDPHMDAATIARFHAELALNMVTSRRESDRQS